MFDRWARLNQRIVSKMMNILNKCFDTLANAALANFFTLLSPTRNLVAGEGLSKHGHEWSIAGKEDGVCWLGRFTPTSRHIQPDQSFPCTRHTSDETNEFVPVCSRLVNQFFNASRSDEEVFVACVKAGDGFN